MEKIKKYIENYLKHNTMNDRYGMYYSEMMDAMNNIISSRDAKSSLPIICTLFDYGYAKGYRAAMAEIKKGDAA